MDFNELRYAIYEGFDNGSISESAADRLLTQFENADIDYDLDMALNEATIAETSFMESAVSYSTADESYDHFVTEAKTFADKVKKAWETFKKWVKTIIQKIERKVDEFKAKITGKGEFKVKLKYDLKKVDSLLSDFVSTLKSAISSAKEGLTDFLTSYPKIASIAGMIASIKVENYLFSGRARDDLVTNIRKSLFTISSMLDTIESKAGDTKLITIIRPVINVVNRIILAAYPNSDSYIETKMKLQYSEVNNLQNDMKSDTAEIQNLEAQFKACVADSMDIEDKIKSGVSDPNELKSLMSRIHKNDATCKAIYAKMLNIGNKYGVTKDITAEHILAEVSGRFIGTRIAYSSRLIRTGTITAKKIIMDKPYDGQSTDVKTAIDLVRSQKTEFDAVGPVLDKIISASPKDTGLLNAKKKYEKETKTINGIMKDVDKLETIAKQRGIL